MSESLSSPSNINRHDSIDSGLQRCPFVLPLIPSGKLELGSSKTLCDAAYCKRPQVEAECGRRFRGLPNVGPDFLRLLLLA